MSCHSSHHWGSKLDNLNVTQPAWFDSSHAAIVPANSHQETSSHGRYSDRFDSDPIGEYLAHMVESPVLTRADEFRLGMQVRAARQHYRLCLLGCHEVLVGVIHLLEKLHRGEVRLDRCVDMAVSDMSQKRRIRRLLPDVIRQLRAADENIQSEFRTHLRKSASLHDQRMAWKRIVALRREAARLAESLNLRTSVLSDLLPRAQATSRRMNWLKTMKRAAGGNRKNEAKLRLSAELNSLMLRSLDSPATLERRLRILMGHYSQYMHLRKQLAFHNVRFVVKIAKQYRGKELPFTDLIQEGNVGLLRAIEKFDPHKGFRLTTYAEWWIRQAIQSAIAQASSPIGIPHNVKATLRKIRASHERLSQFHGRQASAEEVACELGLTTERVNSLRRLSTRAVSLSQAISKSNSGTFVDLVETRSEATSVPHDIGEKIEENLQVLEPREQQILRLRFGLSDGVERTLAEIGKEYRLSRERIRQIEDRAVRKLRQSNSMRALADFIS